jgi:hypothetical protein
MIIRNAIPYSKLLGGEGAIFVWFGIASYRVMLCLKFKTSCF